MQSFIAFFTVIPCVFPRLSEMTSFLWFSLFLYKDVGGKCHRYIELSMVNAVPKMLLAHPEIHTCGRLRVIALSKLYAYIPADYNHYILLIVPISFNNNMFDNSRSREDAEYVV